MLSINDEIGKIIAVFIISPILIYKGLIYNDLTLGLLGLMLFLYDSYWIYKSKTHNYKNNNKISKNNKDLIKIKTKKFNKNNKISKKNKDLIKIKTKKFNKNNI